MSIEIFFCYAHEDKTYLNKLKKHLIPLQRGHLIDTWHDADISPGAVWEEEVNKHLNTAHIILMLISPDFMASDYCYSKEMMRAIERHEQRDARVIPILIRPTHWHEAPFSKLQALPTDAKPITDPSWVTQDRAFIKITEGVRKAIDDIAQLQLAPASLLSENSSEPEPLTTTSTIPQSEIQADTNFVLNRLSQSTKDATIFSNPLSHPTEANAFFQTLVAEIQRLNEIASKIQVTDYDTRSIKQGLTDEEITNFVNRYLAWYGSCLSFLPEPFRQRFISEYEMSIRNFLIHPLASQEGYVEEYDDLGEISKYPYSQRFQRPSFTQRQILFEASSYQAQLLPSSALLQPVEVIKRLANKFHLVVRQLSQRQNGRQSFMIADEYDVQDLFRAILTIFFNDIRAEEWTPSYAGKSSHVDLSLNSKQVAIEIRKTKAGLGAKEVIDQIIIDTNRYHTHPNCKTLILFIYDPDKTLPNPRELEKNLSHLFGDTLIQVIINQG